MTHAIFFAVVLSALVFAAWSWLMIVIGFGWGWNKGKRTGWSEGAAFGKLHRKQGGRA